MCTNPLPTSKLLLHRLNKTFRDHGDRYFHKILSEIGYCGLDPRINPLWVVSSLKITQHANILSFGQKFETPPYQQTSFVHDLQKKAQVEHRVAAGTAQPWSDIICKDNGQLLHLIFVWS